MNKTKSLTNKQLFKQNKKDNKESLKQQGVVDLLSLSFSLLPNNIKGITKLYFILLCSGYFIIEFFKKSLSMINPRNFNTKSGKAIFWTLTISSTIFIGLSFSAFSPLAYWTKNSNTYFIPEMIINIILGLLGFIFTLLIGIVEPMLIVLVYAIQASIYFIGVFPMVLSLTEISAWMLLAIFGSIFLGLLTLFSAGAIFDKMKVKNDNPKEVKTHLLFNIVKAIVVFAGTITFFILSIYTSSLIVEQIFGYNFMTINLVQIVRNITNVNNTGVAPFFSSLLFIIILWALISNLFKFLIILGQRTIEIIVYGTIGASISISASVKDNGDRFNQYFVVMVNKVWTPIFVFIGYMLFLYMVEPLTSAISALPKPDWGYLTNEIWTWTKIVISTIFIMAGSGLMTSLMKSLGILVAGNNFMAAMGSDVGQLQQSLSTPISMMGRAGGISNVNLAGEGSGYRSLLEKTGKVIKSTFPSPPTNSIRSSNPSQNLKKLDNDAQIFKGSPSSPDKKKQSIESKVPQSAVKGGKK